MKPVAIIGGGLAGLITANLLVQQGVECVVFEKKEYPFHRVCGEYISNETVPFLKKKGLFPEELGPSSVSQFMLTSVNGKSASLALDLGGFGISRYAFDYFLYEKAKEKGVQFYLKTEVEEVLFKDHHFHLKTDKEEFDFEVAIGSFGKRSKMDVSLQREFIKKRSPYIGVKYHIRTQHPADLIALHNFKDGYCGISNIEDGKTNLCYLSHRNNLKRYGNIKTMEEQVLYRNPFLKDIFQNANFLFDKPETINEISFETKSPVKDHILMCGDAAGMITPLCGNGMAIAIHASKLVSELVTAFFQKRISRTELEIGYEEKWNMLFKRRLWAGRQIQRLFGNEFTSNVAVNLASNSKAVAGYLMSKTHGKPF